MKTRMNGRSAVCALHLAGFLLISTIPSLAEQPTPVLAGNAAKVVANPSELPPPPVLPAPTEKVVFRKELRSKHPRIFIDAAGVEAFQKKKDDPARVPLLSTFLSVADEIAAEKPQGNASDDNQMVKIGDRLPRIAFAYLVTRKPPYLEGARKWIHAVLNYPHWGKEVGGCDGPLTFDMALAYDWLYGDLSPEERLPIETALLKHGRLLLARSAKDPNSYWGGAYFVSYSWIPHVGISTAAMALYDEDPGEMQGWLDYTRSRFQPTYLHLALDGGYHEGPPSFTFGAVWCLRYIESLRGISGEDLSDMPYLQNLTRRLLDLTMPDGRSVANFGDMDAYNSPPEDELYTWGSRAKDGHGEWLRQKMLGKFVQKHSVSSPFALIWFDPSVSPKAPDELPTTGLYGDLGEVVFRSSWKDDASVVVFRCGPPAGHYLTKNKNTFPNCAVNCLHSHPDANSFLYWSDQQWRIGNPAGYTTDKKTQSENVWLVGGLGQKGGDKSWFESKSYFLRGTTQPGLVRVATSPAADYVIGEAAPAYEAACKLTRFKRHLLFVKGDKPYIAVYDRLRAGEAKSWTSCLHTFGKIDVADNRSFSTMGGLAPMLTTEGWLKLSSLPNFTTAFGVVLGPAGTTLDAHPLNVLDFYSGSKPVAKGFELLAQAPGTSETTWLITVVGVEKSEVALGGSDQAPSVKVGKDQIAWDADGNVSLNGKPVEGNLLPANP